jgi:aminoglycoside phosphotransferase (APT) family kinase protein
MTTGRVRDVVEADLAAVLTAAGITEPHTPLVPLACGEDNQVYATRAAGRDLVVKTARTTRTRAGVAAWAAARLAAAGVPAPAVLGHAGRLLVETRCPGTPLDQYHTHHGHASLVPPADLAAAAGRLLQRLHTVRVRGYGRLDTNGVGLRPTLHSWLLHLPPLPTGTNPDLHALRTQALQVLRHHMTQLATAPAVLLHGDWTARHIIVHNGHVAGVVDLESVRGGDPLADLAGWSLQEPVELTDGLFAGYFTHPPDRPARTRLALYRVRIAAAMLARHVTHAEHEQMTLRTAQLQADLAGLSCQQPAARPSVTPTTPYQEGR